MTCLRPTFVSRTKVPSVLGIGRSGINYGSRTREKLVTFPQTV